eukprot:338787-Pleurochrysis_carterae.AAC.2
MQVDELADKGYMRIEFRSGLGNFAKFLNGGKPFVVSAYHDALRRLHKLLFPASRVALRVRGQVIKRALLTTGLRRAYHGVAWEIGG